MLDTNVWLAALFGRGLCEALLDALIERPGVTILICEQIIDEVREHAVKKFKVPKAEAEWAIDFILRHSVAVKPLPLPKSACKDHDDLAILGAALAGSASTLVTGDKVLLARKRVGRGEIIGAREFFERLTG